MSLKDVLEMEYQKHLEEKEAEENGKSIEDELVQVNARVTGLDYAKLELAAEKYGVSKAKLMAYLLHLALDDMLEVWEIDEKQVMERIVEKSKGEAA